MPLLKYTRPFAVSKRLYALDLSTYGANNPVPHPAVDPQMYVYSMSVAAVWFKKNKGKIVAHAGQCWDMISSAHEPTLDHFLTNYSTARYGASTVAKWDGETFWSPQRLPRAEEDAYIERLSGYLQDYPNIPTGMSGWYLMT